MHACAYTRMCLIAILFLTGSGLACAQAEAPNPAQNQTRTAIAFRTNFLAIPLLNAGIELPLGKDFSVGADIYYPWFWRKGQKDGVDYTGTCTQLLAADLDLRYWFGRAHQRNGQLLGHSVGIYAAGGYYDIERNWTGNQGQFINIGVDYLFAAPIFKGRLNLEFELGLGYIYSPAQPYDCFEEGGKCYRRESITQYIKWYGPTRAQVSLVLPIHPKKGGKK